MDFINNFATTLDADISASSTSLPIPLAALSRLGGGRYTLCLAEKPGYGLVDPELVIYENGSIQRAAEGTEAKGWPKGTVVFAPLTAGVFKMAKVDIDDIVEEVEQGAGKSPPPIYPYEITTIAQDYYSASNSLRLSIIMPISGGVLVVRDRYEGYYFTPATVLMFFKGANNIGYIRNPVGKQGFNWDHWAPDQHPRHGYEPISDVKIINNDIYMVHARNTVHSPPFVIEDLGRGDVRELDADEADNYRQDDKRYIQHVTLYDGPHITRQLSREVKHRGNSIYKRGGNYFVYDYTVNRLVKINSVGAVKEMTNTPQFMVYAQGPDGNLMGLLYDPLEEQQKLGIFNTSSDSYRDISDQIDFVELTKKLTEGKRGSGSWYIRNPLTDNDNWGTLAAYSSGAFYFVATDFDRFCAVAITRR